jgi:hypothetical protein
MCQMGYNRGKIVLSLIATDSLQLTHHCNRLIIATDSSLQQTHHCNRLIATDSLQQTHYKDSPQIFTEHQTSSPLFLLTENC